MASGVQEMNVTEDASAKAEADLQGRSEEEVNASVSMPRIILVLIVLYGISAASAIGTGLVTIGIPQIAHELSLSNGLLLWPGSAFSLASGCCFLLSGTMADLIGSRRVGLSGCLVMTVSLAVTGISQTGLQLIVFRALQGVGAAMFLPTNISIWTSAVPKGRLRNLGFACLSFASPSGLQTGYLLAGAFGPSRLTWRFGFYLCGGIMFLLCVLGFMTFPADQKRDRITWKGLLQDLDIFGMLISILVLGFSGFALAELSISVSRIRSPQVASSIGISVAFSAFFLYWMSLRRSQGRNPLIPSYLWDDSRFSVICLLVVFGWATGNSMDWFFSLFFQEVQGVSGLQTAIRFIPNVLIGLVTGAFTGYLVHRLPINMYFTAASLISLAAPLIMALINPDWSYWIAAFWALIVAPTAQDVLYIISNIIITETMPESRHGLAGGVFNALGGLGGSLGIAILAIVSGSTLQAHSNATALTSEVYMSGYRAAFWTNVGLSAAMTIFGIIGLRNVWRISGE